MDAVVGNSSSILKFLLYGSTVNIGNRQKDRLKASSVIDSEPEAQVLDELKRHSI